MPHPFRAPSKRFDLGKWLMLAALFVLSYFLFYEMTLRPSSDISIHATWATEGDFRDWTSFVHHVSNPIWHVLVSLLLHAGMPLAHASALITSLFKVFIAYAAHRLMTVQLHHKCSRAFITVMTGALMLVSCLCVPSYNPTVYVGVGTPNTWHSCTQLSALAFMVVCVPLTAFCYDEFIRRLPTEGENTMLPWHQPIWLGTLLFLSLLAKPSFMQAFLPAGCLFFLYQWIRHPKNSRYILQVLVCVLPSIAFMIFQYMYYYGIITPWESSMVLELNWDKLVNVTLRAVLMMAFPIYVIIRTRRQPVDTTYVLTILFNVVATLEMLILGENGRRASDGNFGWGMMGAALMLWIICLIRFLKETDVKAWAKPQNLIGWLLLVWHLASGVYYLVYLFTSGRGL